MALQSFAKKVAHSRLEGFLVVNTVLLKRHKISIIFKIRITLKK